mgnify:FL=1
MTQIEPLDGFAVNCKSSGSLDMRFLTTKRSFSRQRSGNGGVYACDF